MGKQTKRHIRILGSVLFLAYLAQLAYVLFFAERYGRGLDPQYRVNLVPLREIRRFLENRDTLGNRAVFLNIFGNVLLFIPFGAILPVLHRKFRRFPATLCLGVFLSLAFETIQYVTRRGSCDIDDVLLNTLGCAAGYLLFWFLRSRMIHGEETEEVQI